MKTRTELLYEEALRCLRLYTGLTNWEKSIESHVDNGYKAVRCEFCSYGRVYHNDKWASFMDEGESVCTKCDGHGITLEQITP